MESGPVEGARAAEGWWLAAATLLVTGVFGTGFWLTRAEGPAPAELAAAAAHVRAGYAPSDAIFLLPPFATRAREWLGDLDPLAVADPAAEDLEVLGRVWLLGAPGAVGDAAAALEASGFAAAESRRFGGALEVRRLDGGPAVPVVYDFVAHLKEAEVWHEDGATRTPCAEWSRDNGQGGPLGRWACPEDRDWFYVAPEWHRMDDAMRLCLWAHPPSSGRLVIRFPRVPLAGVLAGRAGHTANGALHARAPIDLDVDVGGARQRFVIEVAQTWKPFRLQTATATEAAVTFAVSTADAGINHFCFRADTRAAGP